MIKDVTLQVRIFAINTIKWWKNHENVYKKND